MSLFPQLVVNSLIAGSIYALIALSFSLIYGPTKFFNLAHGVLVAIGGYGFLFLSQLGLPFVVNLIGGVVLAGLVGYGLNKIVYQPLRQRKASNTVLLVASLGAFTALQAVVAIIFTSQFQNLPTPIAWQSTHLIFGGVTTTVQLLMFGSAIIFFLGLLWLLKLTRFGKIVRAINDDAEVAQIVGINTEKAIGQIFVLGSAMAGLAGILVGLDTGLEPTMGMSLLLKGVIAAIVGGVGSIPGAILGAFLLGFVENFGIWHISGEWKDAIAFGLLIIFLLFRPSGIMRK